jgi:hypothetical protein
MRDQDRNESHGFSKFEMLCCSLMDEPFILIVPLFLLGTFQSIVDGRKDDSQMIICRKSIFLDPVVDGFIPMLTLIDNLTRMSEVRQSKIFLFS